MRVQEGAGNFFFGVGGFVSAKDNLTIAELPHHAVFVRLAEFFNDFGREQRRFPKALPAERAAEFAGGTTGFRENLREHFSLNVMDSIGVSPLQNDDVGLI